MNTTAAQREGPLQHIHLLWGWGGGAQNVWATAPTGIELHFPQSGEQLLTQSSSSEVIRGEKPVSVFWGREGEMEQKDLAQ